MSAIEDRIKRCIIERLELEVEPQEIADDASLFAPVLAGGMELDSLAAIEIVVALSTEFDLQLDEVPKEAFENLQSLASYVQLKIQEQSLGSTTAQ
jgi:acyl carrier protein